MTRVVDWVADEDDVVREVGIVDEVDVEGGGTTTTVVVAAVVVEVEEGVLVELVRVWDGVTTAVELRTPYRQSACLCGGSRQGAVRPLTSDALADVTRDTAAASNITPARRVPCRAPGDRPSARRPGRAAPDRS